mgnify:CR=1 FL=1
MNILICGAGAIGSNLAALLACDLKGEHEIIVLDKDNVEERNVQAGTQFYQKDQVGMSKVEALQYNIYKWYEREVKIINKEISHENLRIILESGKTINVVDSYDLIIDCLDNYDARSLVQNHWEQLHKKLNILHLGFSDQFTFAIEWAENYKVPTDITSGFDICEMEGAASFVKMVASLGSLVTQEFIKDGKKREFLGNKFSIREVK